MKERFASRLDQIERILHRDRSATVTAYLIVGLGNPGDKYDWNRHNIGFQAIDHLAGSSGIPLRKRRFRASYGEGSIGPHRVVLAKPLTFMNESGQAVAPLSRWYKIPPERILVMHDDLDLPLARIRLRPGGSSGGHKGLQSIIASLGTQEFPRLRIGIGRPTRGDPIDYVLNDFDRGQEPTIRATYPWIERILQCFLDQGIEVAMNEYNGRQTLLPELS